MSLFQATFLVALGSGLLNNFLALHFAGIVLVLMSYENAFPSEKT
jgi:hypothetical protein